MREEPTEKTLSTDPSVSGDAIRQRYLEFYASRGHKILPGASLVPDDPTVLLTIAGMLQFKPIFLGQAPRQVPRATTAQKCIRTNDVENVGRTARHHTFFEMLGNFSFGDYFKREAIKWAWELATKEYVPNNYETDLIYPIIERAAELAGVKYAEADERTQSHLKVIGDHMRAIVYLISDGVTPSNIGRGYVVRRLIRRVVRTGRLIGIRGDGRGNVEGAFLPIVAEAVMDLSTNIDPDVKASSGRILEELHREELRFVQTLERGEKLLDQLLREALASADDNGNCKPCLSGKDAFVLYDTYGFPLEITMEVADEQGVSIDLKGFEVEMEAQRRQSQAAHNVVKLSVGSTVSELSNTVSETEFLGYNTLQSSATIMGLLVNGVPVRETSMGDEVEIILDRTPFYAESGGQIGDRGFLSVQSIGDNASQSIIEITDVQKSRGSLFIHRGLVKEGKIRVGIEVDAAVNAILRQGAKVHHTATHLLQSALKKVVGNETSQAGSLVAFDRLRFDFNLHRPMSEHEITVVESLVNGWIGDTVPLQSQVMPLTDAKQAGAIAMFGEKYGDEVRVVEVPGVSMELCGGTHVNNTAEIRGFKIISEQGIASGIRRIEAVAGEAFIEYTSFRDSLVKQLCSTLKVKAEDIPTRVNSLLEELRTVRNEATALRAKVAGIKASMVANKASVVGTDETR